MSVSAACEGILGYGAAELVGRSFSGLLHLNEADPGFGPGLAAIGGDATGVARFTRRCPREDGGVVWLEWGVAYSAEDGVAYCVARDVTERKEAEEGLRETKERYRGPV